jgi:pyridoxal 5'-phosphate synthase pdxS subunit
MFQFSSEQFRLKVGLAEMLKGGVIMDVTNAEQAKIAEDAGASAVMALERVPSDIRKEGGVARMANIGIMEDHAHGHIPVMAKARIGHFMEARILEALGVDYIDESEVLTPADEEHHIDKNDFKVPFVCGARNLGEALRRIAEGAAMIRTKGEAGSGNIVEAVRHIRTIVKEMKQLTVLGKEELVHEAKNLQAPLELVEWVAQHGKLPVPNFSAGGIATPADAALVMQLGAEAVFVGSGIFKSSDPAARANAIVMAAKNFNNPEKLLEASRCWARPCRAWISPRCRKANCCRPGLVMKKVGVLSLQGDFAAHGAAWKRAGAEPVYVREREQLAASTGW